MFTKIPYAKIPNSSRFARDCGLPIRVEPLASLQLVGLPRSIELSFARGGRLTKIRLASRFARGGKRLRSIKPLASLEIMG